MRGFTAGYNRYVRDVKGGASGHAACRSEAWVATVTEQDLWRRMIAANLAGGYSNFAAAIANATPPAASTAAPQAAAAKDTGA